MSLQRSIVLVILSVLAGAELSVFPRSVNAADEGSFCALVRQRFPQLRWSELRRGDRLVGGDAVLACEASDVTLKSASALPPTLAWVRSGVEFTATVPPERLVVLGPLASGGVTTENPVEVLRTRGRVLYSTDRELVKKLGLSELKRPDRADEARRQTMYADLKAMTWEVLTPGQVVTPWDVIWTHDGGRVEIEIVEPGIMRLVHDGTDVKDPQGRPTGKKRFPENAFVVLHPQFYRKVRVNTVIGQVFVAKDQGKEFADRYDTLQSFLGFRDPQERQRWEEILKRKDLE